MKPSARVATFSDGGTVRRVAVVGGGVAGLTTALKLAEAGVPVDLFSSLPVRRSTSVSAQDGVHAALDLRGEGDSPSAHLDDSLYAGEFLAHQPLVLGMVEAAPQIVNVFDRMGVPFQRTAEGQIDLRPSIGASFRRSAYAGATTGQEVVYALEAQVRRFEQELVTSDRGLSMPGEPMIRKLEYWEFLRLVRDDAGICIGLVAQDLRAMAIKALPFDAVVLATGGFSSLFGRSNPSTSSTGSAAASVYRQGAMFANPEFFQLTATALSGDSRLHAVAESARSLGGRLWVPKDQKEPRSAREVPERDRDYFLERSFPGGKLASGALAARAIFRLCHLEERGVYDPKSGKNESVVYLDLGHLDAGSARSGLGRALTAYARLSGIDPLHEPLKVLPATVASLGGLWVDYERDARGAPVACSPRNHATSIAGLYAVGEVEYQYHGAQRLADDALLSSAYGASLCGAAVASYRAAMARSAFDLPRSLFDKEEKAAAEEYAALLSQNQDDARAENPYRLRDELVELMERDCSIERDNAVLDQALDKLSAIAERATHVKVPDSAPRLNQGAPFVRSLSHALVLARLVLEASRARNESRGGHFKPQFEARNDAAWLRTTLAAHAEGAPASFIRKFDYACAGKSVQITDEIDTSLLPVRPRKES